MRRANSLLIIVAFFYMFILVDHSNGQQNLEFNSAGFTPNTEFGPASSIIVVFENNTNNPSGNSFSSYLPTTTATLTLFNQQYPSHPQNTDNDGTPDNNPSVTLGWEFRADETSSFSDLNAWVNNLQQSGAGIEKYRVLNAISSSVNSNFSASESNVTTPGSTGEGIDNTENWGTFINTGFHNLKGQPFVDGAGDTLRYHMADLRIEFSEPVTDPVFHFTGLGGIWSTSFSVSTTGFNVNETYTNSATTDFELLSSDVPVTLTKLSGTSNLSVVTDVGFSSVRNISPEPSNTGSNAAHGSVLAEGNNINEIVFRLYARGTNQPDPKGFGWGGGHTSTTDSPADCTNINECWYATNTSPDPDEDLVWDDTSGDPLDYYIAEDAIIFSISTQVEPDEIELTGDSCYRMMSSPVDGTSYATLLDPLWTQVAGSSQADNSSSSADPNIWLWPDITGESNTGTAGVDTWSPITATQFENEVPDGTGFLISVFTDDVYQTPGSFPKSLSVTGSENAPLTVTDATGMNSNNDGWSLLGNPFKSSIQIANGGGNGLFEGGVTQGVNTVVYVWDRNTESGAGGNDADNITGSWRTVNASGTGDLAGNAIAPFQGFFVQNTSTGGGNSRVQFRDANKTDGGTFYGKENHSISRTRLEINGQGLFNSMWLQFSAQGSPERDVNDALELMPLTSEYVLMGSKKKGDVIFDIAHFPIPDESLEIPLSFETTRSGTYALSATDFDLSFDQDLYLVDLEEGKSVRLDEDFEYTFTVSSSAKVNSNLRPCDISSGPQKAKTVATTDRFLITTQPKESEAVLPGEFALNQNYPNPFNPTTQITYQLPEQADVRLEVFDMAGRQVATLVNRNVSAGTHSVNFNATNLSSGVYMYRLQAGSVVLTRKLTLIK